MQARYVFCVVSVLWLQASAAPAKENEGLEAAISSVADDNQKVLDKRSAGDQPVFGANNFRERPMVDWNMIYNSKRGVKRPSFGQPQGRFDMLGDNMVNWEKVFSKRKWMAGNEDGQGFGGQRHLSNTDLVNWSKLFAKRAEDKRAFGNVDTGLGSDGELTKDDLQKWAAFARHARNPQ